MTLRKLLERELGSGDDAHRIENLVRKSLDYIQQLEPNLRETVRSCYALSIEAAFALQIALAFGAAIAAFGIREKPLSK